MRIGRILLVIAYVMVCLLSGIHLASVPDNKEQTSEEVCLFVVYDLNDGVNHEANKSAYYPSDFPVKLEIPTRNGYNFAGWYRDENFTQKVTDLYDITESRVALHAKWTKEIDNYFNVENYAYKMEKDICEVNHRSLTEFKYCFWEEMCIPGMPSTREQDYLSNYVTNAAQCMQGLCVTPDYMLMTAYAESDTIPGNLMVFDRESGDYILSLSMKINSHLGGVGFDGANIWICHSQENTLERISYEYLQWIVESGASGCVDISGISDEYPVKNSPSCITCYGDRIWVATHTTVFEGEMISYVYDGQTDTLNAVAGYEVPKQVQGVAFDEEGAIYFSTSYGRTKSSYLKAYSSLLHLCMEPELPEMSIEMPPCSEGVVFVDGSLLILFESASEKYFEGKDGKGLSLAPLDTLLEIDVASMW